MDYPKYDLETNSDYTIYQFTSNGTAGQVDKAIKYTSTKNELVFNLGFGDIIFIDEKTGEIKIDDKVVTDNGDRDTILATVAKSVYTFTETYPEKYLIFLGSTPARTRLYRMAITKNHDELSKTFLIFGAIQDENGNIKNTPFESDKDFDGFFIKRK